MAEDKKRQREDKIFDDISENLKDKIQKVMDESGFMEKLKEKIQKVIDETQLLQKLKEECDMYFSDDLEVSLVNIIKKNADETVNRCMICNCDMGRHNPRQLCGKTYCMFSDLED